MVRPSAWAVFRLITSSAVGLLGGGHIPMPGEGSLAHHGILFLDERLELRRHGLEDWRQALEKSFTSIAARDLR
jgi:magnesium chelatase family protein